ncbi:MULTISPECIES: helix-turn-helix domain-containing protein [Actinoalloteichus]|uniref:DNA binding protein with helix-turn-helix domain n=1 Tax=Actinoalloteichus fjordicus TaxID=1612552 RepID=A0AAC9LEA5_9PSEU|nr:MULTISPECIES: helix-turn-helix transcriptional regulator [Actinoalloteichus]APU16066.1 DNA binding protein with helix-turn-helix domain [Actinoalloteichus fjordicus]APU22131.1 DNA binding protein with helix-turn-helix domain [Actinoalloteichus sp. GBA129-24]
MVGATPRAAAIGRELRRAREDAGLTARQLALRLGKAHTTVGRWESGERAPKPVDLAAALAILDVESALRDELVELARDTDGTKWVAVGLPEQTRQMAAILETEEQATRITSLALTLIPGLIQTREYAQAIIGGGGLGADEVRARVATRVSRRDVLTRRRHPAAYLALIDESALHRGIGDREVMADQLRVILDMAKRPNIEIRIIPLGSGWHPGLEGPFELYERPDGQALIHVENRRSGLFFHEVDDVAAYQNAADVVADVAMSPAESVTLIAEIATALERTS